MGLNFPVNLDGELAQDFGAKSHRGFHSLGDRRILVGPFRELRLLLVRERMK
jgi:hypothetical protein